MPTTKTTVTTTHSAPAGVAVHTISFRGLAGGIFLCLVFAAILYVIGFATTAWSIEGSSHRGLWETCNCGAVHQYKDEHWFKATQAMITIGLILLLLTMILAAVYLCVHSVSKNATILALVVIAFLAVIFMLIGFIIYGAHMGGLNWSFAITVIASILCFIAGVLAVVQLRNSGVRV